MNEKQKRFAEAYATTGNAAEAARRAGYSATNARRQGQRLLSTNVNVRNYIDELQDQAETERIASIAQVKSYWTDVMLDETEKTADRLRASELLAKSSGAFIHKRPDDGIGEDRMLCGEYDGEDVVIYLPDNGRDAHLQRCDRGPNDAD